MLAGTEQRTLAFLCGVAPTFMMSCAGRREEHLVCGLLPLGRVRRVCKTDLAHPAGSSHPSGRAAANAAADE
jgi:hypothetical protein